MSQIRPAVPPHHKPGPCVYHSRMVPTVVGIFLASWLVYGLLSGGHWRDALVIAAVLAVVALGAGMVFGDLWREQSPEGVRMCNGVSC